jgi:transposase-like protein
METKSKARVVRSEADWREIMTRFASSGRTLAEFCRAEGISRSTFDVWREKLRSGKPPKKLSKSSSRQFVEVTPVSPPALGGWTVEIELPDGRLARLRC